MRCSSCEALLDDYLEGTLDRRRMLEVAQHLRECGRCEAFLLELRVVDALLATATAPVAFGPDFTAAVVSATAVTAPAPARRRSLLWPLFAYLVLAWAAVGLAMGRAHEISGIVKGAGLSAGSALAAVGAALRALAPATAVVATAVTSILLLDLLLLSAVLFGYRRLRPMLAVYLAKGRRA